MPTTTRTPQVVRLRVSPDVLDRVDDHAKRSKVGNQSAVLRELLALGLDTAEERAKAGKASVKPYPGRAEVAQRAAYLVELLGDLMVDVERHDPQGAALLSAGLLKAVSGYDRDLKTRATK